MNYLLSQIGRALAGEERSVFYSFSIRPPAVQQCQLMLRPAKLWIRRGPPRSTRLNVTQCVGLCWLFETTWDLHNCNSQRPPHGCFGDHHQTTSHWMSVDNDRRLIDGRISNSLSISDDWEPSKLRKWVTFQTEGLCIILKETNWWKM